MWAITHGETLPAPPHLHLEQILVATQCKLVRLCGLIRMGLNQFKSLPQILDGALTNVREIATAKRHLHATVPRSPRALLDQQQRVAAILASMD